MRWQPIKPDGDWMDALGEAGTVVLIVVACALALILVGHAFGLTP